MSGMYPTSFDNHQSAAYKMATNLYNWALSKGATGLNQPYPDDPICILYRKAAYFSAYLA